MNYTPNYHLPTWAMTDRIQMSDFNDMTAKLDTALGGMDTKIGKKADQTALTALRGSLTALSDRTGGRELKRVTLTKAASSLRLDLSDVDWSQWALVLVGIIPKLSGGSPAFSDGSSYRHSQPTVTVFYPLCTPALPVIGTCLRINNEPTYTIVNTTYDKFSGMDYSCYNGSFEPGTTAWAIGLR